MKKGIIYSFIISMVICMIMPFSVSASTTGNQVTFTNNSVYSGSITLYRVDIQPQTSYTGSTYTYGYYFQTDPGMYGVLSGNFNNNNQDVWSVAVQNGISEMFYSNQVSCYLKGAQLVEYNCSLPQEVIDYIANIDSNVELTTELLDKLVSIRQYNVPFESMAFIYQMLNNFNVYEMSNIYSYQIPIFDLPVNSLIDSRAAFGTKYTFVFGIDKPINTISELKQYFSMYVNGTEIEPYSRDTLFISNDFRIMKVVYSAYNGEAQFKNKIACKFMPIISIRNDYISKNYFSTDFALLFGFSNNLLDDLHIIAQGTQQSQSAAGDLEQGTSDLASDISSYNQIESDYNNQMNQALNNIDFSDQFSNNQNFLSGASFVKTVFNSFMQIDILRIFFIVLCIVLIAKRFI